MELRDPRRAGDRGHRAGPHPLAVNAPAGDEPSAWSPTSGASRSSPSAASGCGAAFIGPFGLIGDRRLRRRRTTTAAPCSARRAPTPSSASAPAATTARPARASRCTTPGGRRPALGRPGPRRRAVRRPRAGRSRLVRSPVGVHDAAPVHLVSTGSLGAVDATGSRRGGRPAALPRQPDRRAGRGARPSPRTPGSGAAIGRRRRAARCSRSSPPPSAASITTFDPDTARRDNRVLAGAGPRARENLFGVYARVSRAGWVEVGSIRCACSRLDLTRDLATCS